MKLFKVRSCGNDPEEAFWRAQADYPEIRKKTKIVGCSIPIDAPDEMFLDQSLMEPEGYVLYIKLDGGEYLFFGAVKD